MKNKKVLLLVLLAIGLLFTNVHAEEITAGNFKVNITGVKYNIYSIDNSKAEDVVYNNGSVTVTLTEDEDNYVKGVYTATVSKNKQIEAEVVSEDINGKNVEFINLGIPLDETEVRGLLTEAGLAAPTTEEAGYLVDYVVDYQITEVPTDYTHFQMYDYYRQLGLNILYDNPNMKGEIQLPITGSQVINRIGIVLDGSEVNYIYENTVPEGMDVLTELSFITFANEEIVTGGENIDESIMFHSYTNIERLIEILNEDDPENPENPENPTGEDEEPEIKPEDVYSSGEEVQVADTAMFRNKAVIGVSLLFIIVGIATIAIVIKKKGKEQKEEK